MIRNISARLGLASIVVVAWAIGSTVVAQRAAATAKSAAGMTAAAKAWLDGLTPELRQQAMLPIDNEDRTRFHFIPTNMHPRKGVSIKEMSEPQRKLAHTLLKAGLSQRGYLTTTAIMELETILHAMENSGGRTGRNTRDPELYFFTIFGAPAPKGVWGWRVEGHHLSLHFTVSNNAAVASTPQFLGTNPHEVREEGPKKGLRVLGDLEDAGRALVMALDDTQRTTAIIEAKAPNDIVTMNKVEISPLSPSGLAASAMTSAQRDLLMKLINAYASHMTDDVAAMRLAALKQAGIEKVAFAWAGDTAKGAQHYYRIQGPTFLVEYDNTQNGGNHVHSIWRDFNGDFGRDLLREHVTAVRH